MSSVYLGAPVFVLGLFALASRPRSPWRWWLAGVALFFILGSLGTQFPLRGWLYAFVWPTRYFRHPALFRVYAMFSVLVLALRALRDIRRALMGDRGLRWNRLLWGATASAAGAIAAYAFVLTRVQSSGPHLVMATLHLVLVWCGTLAVAWMAATHRGRAWLPASLVALAIVDGAGCP